jgi:hypothetical protein
MSNKTVLALCVAMALLAGCKAKDAPVADPAPVPAPAPPAPTAATTTGDTPAPAPVAPAAVAFDINTIPVSDKPLGEWPYVSLPAGYAFDHADEPATRSKDLARVPVWTGGQLLWVEGKVFNDEIDNVDAKTYSQFEVRKNVRQAIEALGGVRVAERSFDEAVRKANDKDLRAFVDEFSEMYYPYLPDQDAETYVIRAADKAVWIVFHSGNDDGSLMVAEGPLPAAPAR